jgi:ABC-2 type transport system permease protein
LAVWLVALREIREGTRERAFAISTGVTLLIVAGVVLLPSLIGGGDDRVRVAVAGDGAGRIAEAAARDGATYGIRMTVQRVASDSDVRRLVRDKEVEAGLVGDGGQIVRRAGTPDGAVPALQAASRHERQIDALRRSGVDQHDTQRILAPPMLAVDTVDPDAEDRQGFAFVVLLVLYMQLIGYGFAVAMGVVQEKQSRIVEILLSTIRPRQLLAGKVLGLGLIGLGQLLLIGTVGLGLAAASGRIDVGATELAALPVVLAWFVLGYTLYASAFAMVGALVPRQEDISSAATPATLALVASFILSFSAIEDPGGGLAQVLTFVPTSSPLVMPLRLISGGVAIWEVAVSVAILLATIAGLVALAGRVYGNAVLQTGGRVRLRAALARE